MPVYPPPPFFLRTHTPTPTPLPPTTTSHSVLHEEDKKCRKSGDKLSRRREERPLPHQCLAACQWSREDIRHHPAADALSTCGTPPSRDTSDTFLCTPGALTLLPFIVCYSWPQKSADQQSCRGRNNVKVLFMGLLLIKKEKKKRNG